MRKIALTGGGTGGHRMPLVAVYQALTSSKQTPVLLYIGEAADCRSPEIVALKIPTFTIPAGKLRRYFDLATLGDMGRVVKGFFAARQILRQERPDILFSKGGYVSVPVVWAAASLHIPVVTHESDVVMGLANRLTARFARTICTAYPIEHYRSLPKEKLLQTGNLIRMELVTAAKRAATEKTPFTIGGRTVSADRPILLVLGGSQGAHRINELIVSLLDSLLSTFTVIHQSGVGDADWLFQRRHALNKEQQAHYFPIGLLKVEELGDALAMAFMVISRAGSVISELALFAKPTILIPLPTSAGGHQLRNAHMYANKDAAMLLSEHNLTPAKLLKALQKLYHDESYRQRLSTAMRALQEKSGAAKIAALLLTDDNQSHAPKK